jgi:ribokinase
LSAPVVGVGIATLDYVCLAPELPAPDRKAPIERFTIQGGGPVATAMVTLQRLGIPTAIHAAVGDDSLGQYIGGDLRREGVDTTGMRFEAGADSSFAFILVEQATGRRSISYYTRGVSPLTPEEIDPARVHGASVLHVDGHAPDAQIHAAALAREKGVPVVYDAGSVQPRCNELVALTDYLVTSEHFPTEYTGLRKLPKAIDRLMEHGPKTVVVTLAEQGCRLATTSGQEDVPAEPVTNLVDTTGAGDVFHGAFIYGILKQWDLRRTCQFANLVAGISCQTLGGRAGIPTIAQVEKIMIQKSTG